MQLSTVAGEHEPIVSTTRSSAPTADAVVEAVATALDTQPADLPPLYQAVDLEAIERVLDTSDDALVTFAYEGLRVAVAADGTVEVYEADE